MKRNLTLKEEQVIRLCHHDHGGLSVEDAAIHMNVKPCYVCRYLRNAERKAPQMFPILTPQHRAILTMRNQHISHKVMIVELGITKNKLIRSIAFLRKHKFLFNRKPDQYKPLMDSEIKVKF